MAKREIIVYDGEHQDDGSRRETTVIAANRAAAIALLSPEVIGAQNPVEVHDTYGRKYPAPRGGFFGKRGYDAAHLDTTGEELILEISPRMSAGHIAEFGSFVGTELPAKGLIAPGESGIFLHDLTGEQDTVTRVASPQPRPSVDDIIAGMELAPARLEAETERLRRMAPALAAAAFELPAA